MILESSEKLFSSQAEYHYIGSSARIRSRTHGVFIEASLGLPNLASLA
jgi:hypothetical protein